MRLSDDQITTAEVKEWQGVHLLHFDGSACSQKVRMLLSEKRIPWVSHPVDLARFENTRPWFLGINPRGVVPVLVHDGAVHVESNDILAYLDAALPSVVEPYFPRDDDGRYAVEQSLALEDSLHMDLRAMSLGFLFPSSLLRKPPDALRSMEAGGAPDAKREREVAWWREFNERGVTPEQTRRSFEAFASAFAGLEERLSKHPWLLGDRISVLEIAWFVSIHRLVLAGYPLERHPRLYAHYERLRGRPSFSREVGPGGALRVLLGGYALYRRFSRTMLLDVVG